MTSLPFPVVWSTRFDQPSIGSHAPCVSGGVVFVRSGTAVRGLDAATGAERWRITLDARGVDGQLAAEVGGLFVTEYTRRIDRGSSLVGIDPGGAIRWRADLPAGARAAAAVPHRGTIWTLTRIDTWRVHAVDAGTGAVREDPAPEGGGNLAVDDTGRIIGVNIPAAGRPALYRRPREGALVACPDPSDGIWALVQDGATLVTAERARAATMYAVCGRDAATLTRLWSLPSAGVLAARDGLTAIATGDADAPVPVLIDTASGVTRWRGATLPSGVGVVMIAPPLVAFGHDRGTILYDVSGRLVGETAERYQALRVVDGALYATTTSATLRHELPCE